MANAIGKYAAKKLLRKQMAKYKTKEVSGDQDPYFARIEVPGKPGKFKKVKKQVPDYIPEHDAVILAKMRSRAYKLDMCLFNFLGIRFGWSSVIGLLPAAGDAIDGLLAFLLYMRCREVECGLGLITELRMLVNIALDLGIGIIPVIGDLGDAAFKANTKNLRLLEERLDKMYNPRHAERRRANKQPATVYEDFSDENEDRRGSPPSYDSLDLDEVRAPAPARVPTERRGEAPRAASDGRGWASSGSKRQRQPDLEMGLPRNGNPQPPSRSSTKKSARR